MCADHLETARRDLALLTDGLRAEREQGITIDVAYRSFATPRRRFIIADAPGHEQYTRNMVTAASTADAAVLLIDARKGLTTQTKRHAFISALLGIRHLLVCVNKIDLVEDREEAFDAARRAFTEFAVRLDVADVRFLPISALEGDNVVQRSARTPWFDGRPLLAELERIHIASDRNTVDLRFPVQLVTRADGFVGYAGRVASGVLRRGAEVLAVPSGRTSRVRRIVTYDGDVDEAVPSMCVTVCLEDELGLERGDLLARPQNRPRVGRRLEAMVVWLGDAPLEPERRYVVKHLTRSVSARVERVEYAVDPETLRRRPGVERLTLNEIGRVAIATEQPLLFDPYAKNRVTGALIVIDPETNATVGAGMVIDRRPPEELPRREAEATSAGGAVVWLTGYSGSGKTTLACAVEAELKRRGRACSVLDGDVLRAGLSRDLGFSPEDRREHLRRVAEAAKLLADAGAVVIVACISPYAADRDRARAIVGPERFLLAHVATPLEECRRRDPKGLYARAEAGEIEQFTGVSAPYETPAAPDLRIDAHTDSVADGVAAVLERLPD